MKSVVLYYSRSGKTRQVAEQVIERFSSEEIFVEPKEVYGNYVSSLIRLGKEVKQGVRVEYKTTPAELSKYDIVFLGFPVWGGVMPIFMQEYVKSCDFSNTQVIPFVTAGSNSKESSLNSVKKLIPHCNEKLYYYTNLFLKENPQNWLDEVETWINTSGCFR